MRDGGRQTLIRLRRTTDSRHKMGMVVINNILNALKGESLTNQVRTRRSRGRAGADTVVARSPNRKS